MPNYDIKNYNNSLNYNLISEKLNEYAVDKLQAIQENFGEYFNEEVKITINKLLSSKNIIVVEKPSDDDYNLFEGKIPSAHGGRTKNDGLIHVYPYIFSEKSTSEIINSYIDELIITHELFHYIFKMNFYDIINNPEFNEFMTEGIVQYFTELFEGKMVPTINYRKNVDLSSEFIKSLLDNNSLQRLFDNKFSNINEFDIGNIIDKWKRINSFSASIKDILMRFCKDAGLDSARFINKIDRLSIDNTVNKLVSFIEEQSLPLSDNIKKCYIDEIKDARDIFYNFSSNIKRI